MSITINPLQREVLAAMALPATRLRWHATTHPNPELAGRGMVMGTGGGFRGDHFTGGPIASYTTRRLVKLRLVRPLDKFNARPFRDGGPPYRDYALTPEGLIAATQ